MKYFIKKTIVTFLILLCIENLHAQQKPFWDEIQNFKKQDSIHFPPKNEFCLLAVLHLESGQMFKIIFRDIQL